jgi:hypothetical protein
MEETKLDKLKSHLSFLIDQYHFHIQDEQYSPETMGNAFVLYVSRNVGIVVECDRNQIFVEIGLTSWPNKDWLQLGDIIRYFYPDVENVDNFDSSIDEQLKHITSYLKSIGETFILGDFSLYRQVKDVENRRVKKMLRDFGLE